MRYVVSSSGFERCVSRMKVHKAAAFTCSISASPSITPAKSGLAHIRSEASLASRQICRRGTGDGSRVASRGVPQDAPADRIPNSWLGRNGSIVLLVSVMVFVASVRLRLADLPLERDEGEYAYAGQLILQGIPPYELAYNMKFPGTYYAYSMILALFGQTPWGVHVGLLILNAGTTIVLFFLGRKLVGIFAAAVGACAFAVLALDHGIMGVFGHATHFVLLPALGGLLVLLRVIESKRSVGYVVAGALLGTAVLMKQQSIFFAPFAAALLWWHDRAQATRRWPQLLLRWSLLAAGGAVPFAALCALFVAQGVLGRFWFWAFQYAIQYVSEAGLSHAWPRFAYAWRDITHNNLPIWLLGATGLVMVWLGRWPATARRFLTGLLLASFLAVCPGFYFRQHYFILMLPVVGLLVGVAVASAERMLQHVLSAGTARLLALLVFVAALTAYLIHDRAYLVSMPLREITRIRYGNNPFIEAVDIARYVNEHTSPDDRIAVLGSEPEIYFYANRKSATGYIYVYPLMEHQPYASRMQAEMIQEIEAAHPGYVIAALVEPSWLGQPDSDRTILRWAEHYTLRCYDLVGVADIHSHNATEMLWGSAAPAYKPRSNNVVYTFRRKSDSPCVVGR